MWPDANTGWWPLLWFVAKVLILMFCFVWLRGTLPRIRYDQLMALGWKVLIPVSLAWILMIATIRVWRQHGGSTAGLHRGRGDPGGAAAPGLDRRRGGGAPAQRRRRAPGRRRPAAALVPGRAMPAAGFPVPPLDLPHYHGVGVVIPTGGPPAGHGAVPDGAVKEVTGA